MNTFEINQLRTIKSSYAARVQRDAHSIQRAALYEMAKEIISFLEGFKAETYVGLNQPLCLKNEVRNYERDLVRAALLMTRGHLGRAGQLLGVKTTTLSEKVKRLGIDISKLTGPADE